LVFDDFLDPGKMEDHFQSFQEYVATLTVCLKSVMFTRPEHSRQRPTDQNLTRSKPKPNTNKANDMPQKLNMKDKVMNSCFSNGLTYICTISLVLLTESHDGSLPCIILKYSLN